MRNKNAFKHKDTSKMFQQTSVKKRFEIILKEMLKISKFYYIKKTETNDPERKGRKHNNEDI